VRLDWRTDLARLLKAHELVAACMLCCGECDMGRLEQADHLVGFRAQVAVTLACVESIVCRYVVRSRFTTGPPLVDICHLAYIYSPA
jgi:hypothetical protein